MLTAARRTAPSEGDGQPAVVLMRLLKVVKILKVAGRLKTAPLMPNFGHRVIGRDPLDGQEEPRTEIEERLERIEGRPGRSDSEPQHSLHARNLCPTCPSGQPGGFLQRAFQNWGADVQYCGSLEGDPSEGGHILTFPPASKAAR